jgi:acetyl-CoA acyltransferase 1
MGITSDNVSRMFAISREDQDKFAMDSHRRASDAQRKGLFTDEICSTRGCVLDDGIRHDCSLSGLARLAPIFSRDGTTTAGNASQVSDGASALLVAREEVAEALGQPALLIFRGFAVVGVPPEIMGIGPAYAIPEAVRRAGLRLEQVDYFEINEAFASQALYCARHLGIPLDKLNPLGGAIALGHPLGCTGNRQIVTLMHWLRRTKKRYGVVSMCVGTGMGAAAVFENPDYIAPSRL